MIVGLSSKNNFGVWDIQVVKFTDRASADFWLNKEQYNFRDRSIFDSEEEAMGELLEYGWDKARANKALKFALTGKLNKKEGDIEFEESQIDW